MIVSVVTLESDLNKSDLRKEDTKKKVNEITLSS